MGQLWKHENTKLYSRIIKAPDDIDYLITLEGWYWNALDWMDEATPWDKDYFVRIAWRSAKLMEESGTMTHKGCLKSEFQTALKLGIYQEIIDLAADLAQNPKQ